MAIEKTSDDELPLLLGAFKPVGRIVVALESDDEARRMAASLHAGGFANDEVELFPAQLMCDELGDLLPNASGAAGFGWEIQSMRQYHQLAREGCGWLIVRANNHAKDMQVVEVAKRHRAKLANKYNLLTVEELI